MQNLNAAVLCHDNEGCSSLVPDYLASERRAFFVTHKGRVAACEMLTTHAHRLSVGQLSDIEAAVLQCWPRHQNRLQESYGAESPKTCLGTWRGHQQMTLLRAFPRERLSDAGRRRLAEMERKFDSVNVLYGPPRRETPLNREAVSTWNPERFLRAIIARQKRIPKSWRHWSDRDGNVGAVLREVVAKRPADFIHFLGQCDSTTPKAFIDEIDVGLMNLELDSELALEAAKQFHRLGPAWSQRTIRLLEKVKPGSCQREAFWLALGYARNGSGVTERQPAEEGKVGQRLHSLAINSTRGQAIGALCQML